MNRLKPERNALASAFIVVLVALLTACSQTTRKDSSSQPLTSISDVSELFSNNLSSTQVVFNKVFLGQSKKELVASIGVPDNFTSFNEQGVLVENYEYGPSLGFKGTGLVVHLEGGMVKRIIVTDRYAPKQSIIGMSKEDLFLNVGLPDKSFPVYRFILYKYPERGLGVVAFRGKVVELVLSRPEELDDLKQSVSFKVPLKREVLVG